MKKKMIKKILSALMIAMLISTDFFALGSNIISYATEIQSDKSATNNKNIKFFTYFKDEKGEFNIVEIYINMGKCFSLKSKNQHGEDTRIYEHIFSP